MALELTTAAREIGFYSVQDVLDTGVLISALFGGTPESVAIEDGLLVDSDTVSSESMC